MKKISAVDLLQEEYKIYQMYTLMDRAIPYLKDGLKPSQRRILFTLWKNKNKGLLKVSAATGLVLTLHPHGPASIESSIVNLGQNYAFSNNYPLIEKKGYFGERLETKPAAGRYIECRLAKISETLLFDDMNQVPMVDNYDERTKEPLYLLPKLPLMLLNGAEGIGTGFSSVIPSFNHKDIIDSMVQYIRTGKAKKIKPWFSHYEGEVFYDKEKQRYITSSVIEFLDKKSIKIKVKKELQKSLKESYYITELPKGYDNTKITRHLAKLMDLDILKDFEDYSEKNTILIRLIFKKGTRVTDDLLNQINIQHSLSPNYTLISDNGVEVFNNAEEIISLFTEQRKLVIKERYRLLIEETQKKIALSNEIIRFIKEKHYAVADKKNNRADYLKYLTTKKFQHKDYLSDLPIYRMTKDEVSKQNLIVKDQSQLLKDYQKIYKSKKMLDEKLIEELSDLKLQLSNYLRQLV